MKLGVPTNNVKSLKIESEYYKAHAKVTIKGDRALNVFGKSEDDGIKDIWWDSVKKECLPWRGGGIITGRGTFHFCVYVTWWTNKQEEPVKLLNRLSGGLTIEHEPITIYFWKCADDSVYTPEDPEEAESPKDLKLSVKQIRKSARLAKNKRKKRKKR